MGALYFTEGLDSLSSSNILRNAVEFHSSISQSLNFGEPCQKKIKYLENIIEGEDALGCCNSNCEKQINLTKNDIDNLNNNAAVTKEMDDFFMQIAINEHKYLNSVGIIKDDAFIIEYAKKLRDDAIFFKEKKTLVSRLDYLEKKNKKTHNDWVNIQKLREIILKMEQIYPLRPWQIEERKKNYNNKTKKHLFNVSVNNNANYRGVNSGYGTLGNAANKNANYWGVNSGYGTLGNAANENDPSYSPRWLGGSRANENTNYWGVNSGYNSAGNSANEPYVNTSPGWWNSPVKDVVKCNNANIKTKKSSTKWDNRACYKTLKNNIKETTKIIEAQNQPQNKAQNKAQNKPQNNIDAIPDKINLIVESIPQIHPKLKTIKNLSDTSLDEGISLYMILSVPNNSSGHASLLLWHEGVFYSLGGFTDSKPFVQFSTNLGSNIHRVYGKDGNIQQVPSSAEIGSKSCYKCADIFNIHTPEVDSICPTLFNSKISYAKSSDPALKKHFKIDKYIIKSIGILQKFHIRRLKVLLTSKKTFSLNEVELLFNKSGNVALYRNKFRQNFPYTLVSGYQKPLLDPDYGLNCMDLLETVFHDFRCTNEILKGKAQFVGGIGEMFYQCKGNNTNLTELMAYLMTSFLRKFQIKMTFRNGLIKLYDHNIQLLNAWSNHYWFLQKEANQGVVDKPKKQGWLW